MASFYVTGQKRVGKTSLALTAAEFARGRAPAPGIEVKYILWGRIAHEDPRQSLTALGEQIAEFITQTLPPEAHVPSARPDTSLASITRLAELAERVRPGLKYVLIIGEFDEIHPELYQHGNLAETFFANIRALTTCENLCLVLVGGENMPFIMDRRGQKLNRLVRVGLDYFSRLAEWEDFQLLVRKPTEGTLTWHEEAVSEIFNFTNGNPYFAKIVCASVFESAIAGRDADVTAREVRVAIDTQIPPFDGNSFAHLWQDGIYKATFDRDPDILRRCRTLVAISRAGRLGRALTLANVAANRHGIMLSESDASAVLDDFVRRNILREKEGQHEFRLPIFEQWLLEVGGDRLLADRLGEELAKTVQSAEDAAYIGSKEIVDLTEIWPSYQGRRVTTEDVRAWCQQVGTHVEQRLLFKNCRAPDF